MLTSLSIDTAEPHKYTPRTADPREFLEEVSAVRTSYAILALLLFAGSNAALAHHGNASFDTDKTMTLKGTITSFVWTNPHSQIYFDVKDAKGQVTHWSCEAAQPALLHRAGWTRHSLKAGDEVTIIAHVAKTGAPVAYLVKIILPDGQELKLGSL
jgi:hypothetical protein